jgi:TldD protein
LEGDFNRKETSAFSGRVGQRVASAGITVVDDGTLGERRGSLNLDDEGQSNPTNGIDRRRILRGYMQDRMNAQLMGVPFTGTAGANRSRICRCRA